MEEIQYNNTLSKLGIVATACALSFSMAGIFSQTAFADEPVGTVTNDGTTGSTDLYLKINDLTEREVPAENVNFTVPTRINYVAEADGDIFGPTNAYIENLSAYRAYASAYQTTGMANWNIVEDATTIGADIRNAVTVNIGPSADSRNIAEGGITIAGKTQKGIQGATTGSKISLTNSAWDMRAKDTASEGDRVNLATGGKIANVDENINDYAKFATINWFVTPGTRV